MTKKHLITKVYENKSTGQKLVTIPKTYEDIQPGDYIKIIKMEVLEK